MGNTVIICGKILNYSNKKISLTILPTDPITMFEKSVKIRTKTSAEGLFYIKLENIDHFLYENILKIGSEKIYMMIAPGDSINISFNYGNKADSIRFSGVKATKNYFFNTFLNNLYDSIKITDFDLKWLEKTQLLLNQYAEIYNIDENSVDIIDQYLSCYYYNEVLELNDADLNSSLLDRFNQNNEHLTWYYLYYSVLSRYMSCKEGRQLFIDTDYGLERSFNLSEKYLIGQIKENYKAYLISFNLSYNSSNFKNSQKAKEIMNEFVANCKNDYVRKNISELLRKKRML